MRRLLIVDAEPGSREALRLTFARDYQIAAAADARAARSALDAQGFDLVLVDPGARGGGLFAFFQELLRARGAPAVIVVSAAGPEALPRGPAGRVAACVRKPFDVVAIRRVVARVLGAAPEPAGPEEATPPAPGATLPVRPSIPRLNDAVRELERGLIVEAMKRSDGVQTRAARMLGTTRRVLCYKMRKLGIRDAESGTPVGPQEGVHA